MIRLLGDGGLSLGRHGPEPLHPPLTEGVDMAVYGAGVKFWRGRLTVGKVFWLMFLSEVGFSVWLLMVTGRSPDKQRLRFGS
jgi:hypothetical protein